MRDKGSNLLGVHLGRMLVLLSGSKGEEARTLTELVANLVAFMDEGHSCLPITDGEKEILLKTGLASNESQTPLVIDGNLLYLQRYYTYESRLARQIASLAKRHCVRDEYQPLLDHVFGVDKGSLDLQKFAAQHAIHNNLCIISGGPGTGKTSTVVRIIGILVQLFGHDCKIVLAAPTGKAAMRLRQSVIGAIDSLPFTDDIKRSIPEQAATLHRLLGVKRHSPQFHHTGENPMDWDVVVVDEASMVDLALMSKLVDALKPGARLILLGDKDQLVSVEAGAVLSDLIDSLPANTVVLQKSYRFDEGIRSFAEAVNTNAGKRAWSLLTDRGFESVGLLRDPLADAVIHGFKPYFDCIRNLQDGDYGKVFQVFGRFCVLCALRSGRSGLAAINALVEQTFACGEASPWYVGRPVMILKNDYGLDLYNGDIGICLPDVEDGGVLKVWFEGPEGGLRSILPSRLPQCETVFSLTIHKSQGSEFDEVLIVLPHEDNNVLSRELIYTAITRAKKKVRISCDQAVFALALSRKTQRSSGLRKMVQDCLREKD